MKKSLIVLFTLISSNILLADNNVEAEIKSLVEKNLQFTQAEDLEKVMSTVHTMSPNYEHNRNILEQLTAIYDLDYVINNYRFITHDNDLAYVRITQTTKKVAGPAFNNNKVDTVWILKQEKNIWKLWTQAIISIEYLDN